MASYFFPSVDLFLQSSYKILPLVISKVKTLESAHSLTDSLSSHQPPCTGDEIAHTV